MIPAAQHAYTEYVVYHGPMVAIQLVQAIQQEAQLLL